MKLPLYFWENLDFQADNITDEFFKNEFRARRIRIDK